MPVVNPWIDTSLNLGPNIAPTYLNAWVAQRASMNASEKANMPDPVKLAEQEAKVRDTIVKLRRAQIEAETEKGKQGTRLKEAKVRAGAVVTAAGIHASAQRTVSLNGLRGRMAEVKKSREESDRKSSAVADAEMVGALSTVGTMSQGQAPDKRVDSALRTFNDARAKLGNPSKGSLMYDGAASLAVQAMSEADPALGQALAEKLGAQPGESWGQYQDRVHKGFTDEEVAGVMRDAEKYKAGGGTSMIQSFLDQFEDDGIDSEKVKLGVNGLSPDEDTIKGLEDMADSLGKQQMEAMLARSRYPAANELIANPNRFHDAEALRRAKIWGANTREYNEEVADQIDNTGSLDAAIKKIGNYGGISSEGPGSGVDRNAYDTPPVDASTLTGTQEGEGGYTYTFNDDGTITVQHGDRAPTKVEPRSKAHAAIVAEFTSKRTAGLPEDKRALYDDMTVKALAGDFKGARAAAAKAAKSIATGNWDEKPDYTARELEIERGRREQRASDKPLTPTGNEYRDIGARGAALGYGGAPVIDKSVKPKAEIVPLRHVEGLDAARPSSGAPLKIGAKPYDSSSVIAGEDTHRTAFDYMPTSREVDDAGFDAALTSAVPDVDDADFDAALEDAFKGGEAAQAATEDEEYAKILTDAAKAKEKK